MKNIPTAEEFFKEKYGSNDRIAIDNAKEELNLMYLNRGAIGGFAAAYYWSSSEYNNYIAWNQFFYYGNQYNYNKDYTYYVRAVRSLSI